MKRNKYLYIHGSEQVKMAEKYIYGALSYEKVMPLR
jgi:hypothetical protein